MSQPFTPSVSQSTHPVQMSASMELTRETILLVDDTPENLRVLASALEQKGYEICVATSGRMALNSIETILPDLILLDIRMPDLDGYEVCQQLKDNYITQHIPVIFISAIGEELDRVKAFGTGAADYIVKPFHLEETLARIACQLKIRQLQRRLEERNIQLQQEVQERKQAELELAKLNTELELQVQARTAKLQIAYDFEATLKRITDRVRDSLDEHQILQSAMQEVAQVIGADGCNAALYNLSEKHSTVRYEYTNSPFQLRGRVLQMNTSQEIYNQLLQGQSFQFCSLLPNPERGSVSLLVCPILEEQRVLGDLWLIKQSDHVFTQEEISLVQQVSNQCAIALRQARLYQESQAHVQELERLNRLKDDFLNTISHELRTPMANIKMAVQLLEISLSSATFPNTSHNPSIYLKILQTACEKEIKLITDLLYVSRLDDFGPLELNSVNVEALISQIIEPYREKIRDQQQSLEIAIAKPLPTLMTNPALIQRIITELVDNACKYTPPHEHLLISAQVDSNDFLEISISNSGVTVATEELTRMFDRFYRIPNNDPWKYPGTGLGLALIKKQVEQLKGTITASNQGGWMVFTVLFPLSQ